MRAVYQITWTFRNNRNKSHSFIILS